MPKNENYDLWSKYFTGSTGLFSFILKEQSKIKVYKMIDKLKLFKLGFSWGGYESLAVYTDPVELGNRRYFKLDKNEHLVRLHIGLEDSKDLINDLKRSIKFVN